MCGIVMGVAENKLWESVMPRRACSAEKDRKLMLSSGLCREGAEEVSRLVSMVADMSDDGGVVRGAGLYSAMDSKSSGLYMEVLEDVSRLGSIVPGMSEEGVVRGARSRNPKISKSSGCGSRSSKSRSAWYVEM